MRTFEAIDRHPGRSAAVAFVLGSLLVGGAWASTVLERGDDRGLVVTGGVRCKSGAAVQGVWIETPNGGRGFADWSPGSDPSDATFYKEIGASPYAVHVGCGGTPQHWGQDVKSALTPVNEDSPPDGWVCHDDLPPPQKVCVAAEPK